MKPVLVIISDTIRRDLHRPLGLFKQFDVVHLYKSAGYEDMRPEDFIRPQAIAFTGLFNLYRKLKAIHPTILQAPEPAANSLSFKAALVCLVYWYFYKPKLVVPFFENRPFYEKFPYLKFVLVVLLTRRLRRAASLMIVLNKGAKRNLLSIGVEPKKIVYLMWGSWGIDTKEFKPQPTKQKNKIVFLGRVSEAKGVATLVRAFKTIKEQLPNAQLVIAGLPGDTLELVGKSQAEYVGAVKNADVPRLLAAATVVAMPSQTTKEWEEQVGMVGLQALACGTPVVATKSGAIPEYFEENQGVQLVKEKDHKALAKALLRVLVNDAYLKDQEKKARQYIVDRYEVTKQIGIIEDKLLELLK